LIFELGRNISNEKLSGQHQDPHYRRRLALGRSQLSRRLVSAGERDYWLFPTAREPNDRRPLWGGFSAFSWSETTCESLTAPTAFRAERRGANLHGVDGRHRGREVQDRRCNRRGRTGKGRALTGAPPLPALVDRRLVPHHGCASSALRVLPPVKFRRSKPISSEHSRMKAVRFLLDHF